MQVATFRLKQEIDFILETLDMMPIAPPMAYISEYAESKRVLPVNTPFPGQWDNRKTPYSVEIMDNMSPHSPIQHTVMMKGAQLGLTAAAECILAYWMDECPAEIMYVTATNDLLKVWGPKRLEPLIDSCGFRHKIKAQIQTAGSRRTGDKLFSKEFIGGTLDIVSAQSASRLRADSKRILIRDEVDGAPKNLPTGEGSFMNVSYARTTAYGSRKKILDITTPTTVEKSVILPLFESGDQRNYLIPCPMCNKVQKLEFGHEKTVYGLKAETKAGIIIGAHYICDYCHDAIFDYQKTEMLIKGKWHPTAKSSDPKLRSYQLSSLYSPVGMLSWTELVAEWIKAEDEPDGMRDFTMLRKGEPFKESGSRPKLRDVIELQGGYKAGTIPSDEILFLTGGIDVQQGSAKDPKNPARLELEILAHGSKYKSWSILYKRFEGDVFNAHAGAWQKLNDWVAEQNGFEFRRKDGLVFSPMKILIDSGDGMTHDAVYDFCSRWRNTLPSKGYGWLRRYSKGKDNIGRNDEMRDSNFIRFRVDKEEPRLVTISTNYYKRRLYNQLKIRRLPMGPQPPQYQDFPRDYNESYFEMLTAETMKAIDGSFHCPSGVRNESMDCRVMNMCAADIYLRDKTTELQIIARKNGANASALSKITSVYTLELLAKKIANRKPLDNAE